MKLLWGAIVTASMSFAAQASELKMTTGWSVKPDVTEAVKETFAKIKKKGVSAPQFVLYYATSHYDSKKLVKLVNEQFKNDQTFGMNVINGVFTEDGLHLANDHGAMAAMVFEGPISVSLGGMSANPEELFEVEQGANGLVSQIMKQADRKSPDFILVGGQLRGTYGVLKKLEGFYHQGSKLIGGAAVKKDWSNGDVFVNDKIYNNGFNLAFIYTRSDVGTYMHSGFLGKRKSGKITKIDGYRIYEIDNKPAADVYMNWAGPEVSGTIEIGKGQPQLSSHPFARRFKSTHGDQYISINPWIFHPDKSITIGVYMEKGEEIYYIEGDQKILVNRTEPVTKRALVDGKIPFSNLAGGIHLYCAGASEHVGVRKNDSGHKIVAGINKGMKGRPMIGAFTNSEQGTIPGVGYFDGNLMSAMAVFSSKERESR